MQRRANALGWKVEHVAVTIEQDEPISVGGTLDAYDTDPLDRNPMPVRRRWPMPPDDGGIGRVDLAAPLDIAYQGIKRAAEEKCS